ncbi:MAG: carbon storage regulator CsrA [Candidatus Brocadiae bacterium]|nr:carbon storage regulator CsrA [Candidatus Brocadiia bacterium]
MLVLTRGIGEAIVIGDGIEVQIVEIRGDKVRLGISAPASVAVHRKEIWVAIRDANIAAADTRGVDLAADLLKRKPPGGGAPPPAKP